jgi:hypothetical protein
MLQELFPYKNETYSQIGDVKDTNDYVEKFIDILSGDLNFHSKNSIYSSHNFHSFPAKFPPQLPSLFIKELTAPGDNKRMMPSGFVRNQKSQIQQRMHEEYVIGFYKP